MKVYSSRSVLSFYKGVGENCGESETDRVRNKKGESRTRKWELQRARNLGISRDHTQYFGVLLNLFQKPPNLEL